MNELALFTGAGGGVLAGQLLGWTCVGACEIEEYPRKVLLARQRDGMLRKFPVWDDIRTFDGRPWRGLVDIISGGFPCQDISSAGKGAGLDGKRSGLWSEMLRVVCEVRPQYVFVENSPLLTRRGLGRVLGGLAAAGYDAAWICLSAADCGAPHERKRLWLLGVLTREEKGAGEGNETGEFQRNNPEPDRKGLADAAQLVADTNAARLPQGAPERPVRAGRRCELAASCDEVPDTAQCGGWWSVEPNVGRMANGVAARVDRLKALGNGQVPIVAATAFLILRAMLEKGDQQ